MFSNQIHQPKVGQHLSAAVFNWMRRNWQFYADAEAIAEQAVFEFGISIEAADELAAELKREMSR